MLRRYLLGTGRLSEHRWFSASSNLLKDIGDNGKGSGDDPAAKLNALLLSIGKEDKSEASKAQTTVNVPKARPKQRLKYLNKTAETSKNLGTRIVEAAKDVADKIDGDKQEIEAQLLQKILYKNSPVKKEILKASAGNQHLTDLLTKMEIEKEESIPAPSPRQPPNVGSPPLSDYQTKHLIGRKQFKKPISNAERRVNLFGESPLGIFNNNAPDNKGAILKTWAACDEREKKLSVTHQPSNYFEQMIDWTEKGIIWKFPIDNEQGLDEEKSVSFSSHVLLEHYLEGWCPVVGPIRHFMELVCVGLSRNHWLTAEEKKDHIMWYKEFFGERRKLIKELGAGEVKVPETVTPP